MMLEPSHYLDFEVLKYSNFPELQRVMDDIDQLDDFAMSVNSAIAGYVDGTDDKVYINIPYLEEHIELARKVLDTLGTAERPCFDVITQLREILETFYELLYIHRRYGKEYIDYNTTSAIITRGGGIFGD